MPTGAALPIVLFLERRQHYERTAADSKSCLAYYKYMIKLGLEGINNQSRCEIIQFLEKLTYWLCVTFFIKI